MNTRKQTEKRFDTLESIRPYAIEAQQFNCFVSAGSLMDDLLGRGFDVSDSDFAAFDAMLEEINNTYWENRK